MIPLNKRRGLPKHCSYEVDRHGRKRIRFRWRKVSRYIAGKPWSPEFMSVYGELLVEAARGMPTASATGIARSLPHSLDTLITAYLTSPVFLVGAPETQRTRRNILKRFAHEHGAKPLLYVDARGERVMLLKRAGLQKIVNEKAKTPSAQRNFVNTMKAMFGWAMKEGRISDNPCLGVERERISTAGYKAWSENEVASYEAHWPIGTMARLAFSILLHTGARRSDAVGLGAANIHRDRITFAQQKTGTVVDLPQHPRLAEILAATPTVGIRTFIVTGKGRPFTVAGFGNKFRKWCNAAGCPDVSAHGLRKLCAVRLAEAGATAHEIMSVLGHATLAECERYTEAAERKRLADQAMGKLLKDGW